MSQSRTEARGHLPEVLRIERLEEDADMTDDRYARIQGRLDKILWALVSASVAFASTALAIMTFGR